MVLQKMEHCHLSFSNLDITPVLEIDMGLFIQCSSFTVQIKEVKAFQCYDLALHSTENSYLPRTTCKHPTLTTLLVEIASPHVCRAYYNSYISAWFLRHLAWRETIKVVQCSYLCWELQWDQNLVSFFLLWQEVFSAAISDLTCAKELLHPLFASHALTLFVFWSGLPLASNGLPSTHKSHLYTSFDPPSILLHHVLLSVPHLSLCEAIFCHKKQSDNAGPFSCVLERHFYRHWGPQMLTTGKQLWE